MTLSSADPIEAVAEQRHDRDQVGHRALQPYQVGDVLPLVMGVDDMRCAFPVRGHVMSRSRFHELERLGRFRKFQLPSVVGTKQWSGLRVARHLTGDSFAIDVRRRG